MKYVALLAFRRLIESHTHLVSTHQDVIMDCLEDPDISIRLLALDLGAGLVNSNNLIPVVTHMLRQLSQTPLLFSDANDRRDRANGVEPAADSDGEDPEAVLKPMAGHENIAPRLPPELRLEMVRQIIQMCSQDTYSNITDFEWYIDVLVRLVGLTRLASSCLSQRKTIDIGSYKGEQHLQEADLESVLGWELRNVAVRVQTVRPEAVKAAYSLVASFANEVPLSTGGVAAQGVLAPAVWVVGEYCGCMEAANLTFDPLIHPRVQSLLPVTICAYLQAIPKVLATLTRRESHWNSERQSMKSLLLARIERFLLPLVSHPQIEVQERSVQLIELIRIALQSIAGNEPHNASPPPLLTQAIPELFVGFNLNPVASAAQRKVPLPDNLDLNASINENLRLLLDHASETPSFDAGVEDFDSFYNRRSVMTMHGPALKSLASVKPKSSANDRVRHDKTTVQNRTERRNRDKDDPFYIGVDDMSRPPTPFHEILESTNGNDVDVDSIPIMNLDLGDHDVIAQNPNTSIGNRKHTIPKRYHIIQDENILTRDKPSGGYQPTAQVKSKNSSSLPSVYDNTRKPLLQVDSSGLIDLPLSGEHSTRDSLYNERDEAQDIEMARALAEVERLRLEMQRASERLQSTDGAPTEGTLIKKRRKKKVHLSKDSSDINGEGQTTDTRALEVEGAEVHPSVKRKKKTKKPKQQKLRDGRDTVSGTG